MNSIAALQVLAAIAGGYFAARGIQSSWKPSNRHSEELPRSLQDEKIRKAQEKRDRKVKALRTQ